MTQKAIHIKVEGLTVEYDRNKVLEDLSLDIAADNLTAIIGPNGSGKTTFLKAIMGLIPYRGKIRFCDDAQCDCKPAIGYVPQRFDFDRYSPLKVAEFMVMDKQSRPLWLGIDRELKQAAATALARVGIKGAMDRPLGSLSGGEMQRVLLAKALLHKPQILLCDEPIANVDIAGEELFCDLLENLQHENHFILLMVSHDLSIVTRHATQVVCLNRQLICQGSVTDVITPENIRRIYGIHMGFHQHGSHEGHRHG